MIGGFQPVLEAMPGATKQNLSGSQEKVQTRFTLQQSQMQQQSLHTKQTASISQEQTAQQPQFQYSMLKAKRRNQMQVQEAALKQKTTEILLAEMKTQELLMEVLPMKTKITVLAVKCIFVQNNHFLTQILKILHFYKY